MHKLMELKEKLIEELEDYSQNGKFSKEDAEAIKYISSSIDHICNIMDHAEGEYSNMGGGSYYDDGSYRGGSYARGRGRNAKRDSMGRYSRERGYSRASDDIVMELKEIMQDAPESMKYDIQKLISKAENM